MNMYFLRLILHSRTLRRGEKKWGRGEKKWGHHSTQLRVVVAPFFFTPAPLFFHPGRTFGPLFDDVGMYGPFHNDFCVFMAFS